MKPNGKKRSFWKGAWGVVRVLLLAFALMATAFVLFFAVRILSLDAWREFDPNKILGAPQTLIVYDMENREYTRLHATQDRVYIPISEIPKIVRYAFVSAEDARYYEHSGVDVIRILGAAWEDIKAGGFVQGASTITQQLIKLSHLTADKTISRKLEEAVLAYQMEKQFDKDQILEMYLNYVYFGAGCYGIEAASLHYFGIPARELSVWQAATLAGTLKSPTNYAPHIEPEASRGRRDHILALMCQYGYLSEEEKLAAQAEPLTLVARAEQPRGYYVDSALEDACALLGVDMNGLLTGGYRVYTAMDKRLQQKCEALFTQAELFPTGDCQAAIAVERTGSGLVAAMVGGRGEGGAMAFNRARDIRRQPGSLIKPVLVYAPALERHGYTAATMLLDEVTVFGDYAPRNSGNKYYGWVTLRDAVKRSLNVPAVKVLDHIGVDTAKAFAASLGVEFDENDTSLTLALGGFSYGVSPMQMASAYACFASGGEFDSPSLIRLITDARGNELYRYEPERERVMSEANAYILTSMLQSAIEEGTGRRLGELGISLAGKTGTVGEANGNRDAWMAAYNPDYSACVWMGYDNANEGSLPDGATGGKYPALLLYEMFRFLYPNGGAPDFARPEGVLEVKLDAHTLRVSHTAVLANAFTPRESVMREVFVTGTEPVLSTSYWTIPIAARNFNVTLSAFGQPLVSFTARDASTVYQLFRASNGAEAYRVRDFQGSAGQVRFEDVTAPAGANAYYVVPVHPKMTVNGKPAAGVSTRTVSVYVEGAMPEETPQTTQTPGAADAPPAEIVIEDPEFDGVE